MVNQYLWRNAAAPVEVGGFDIVALTISAFLAFAPSVSPYVCDVELLDPWLCGGQTGPPPSAYRDRGAPPARIVNRPTAGAAVGDVLGREIPCRASAMAGLPSRTVVSLRTLNPTCPPDLSAQHGSA